MGGGATLRSFLKLGLSLLALAAAPALADQAIELVPTIDGVPVDEAPIRLDAERTVAMGLRITDAKSGFPLGDLHPALWVRPATDGRDACAAAVDRYLSLGPNAGIDEDLNGYLFATLNADHGIGVMDPKLDLATSNLLSLTPRNHPADAWWLDRTRARLFVAAAGAGRVEAIDLLSGGLEVVTEDLDGASSIAAFPELDRLWIAGHSRVDGLSLEKGTPLRATDLPAGAWQIAADRAGLRLLALDHDSGRLLVLHPESGVIERERRFGGARGMLVHDPKADAVYALGADGSFVDRLFLDAEYPTRHPLPIAADQLLLTADGEWIAGLNTTNGDLVLIDAPSLRPVHVLRFDGRPDQMRASENYLYLLEQDTGYASLVHLPSLSREKSPGVLRIPIGPAAARDAGEGESVSSDPSAPNAIAPLVEGGGAIIASAADKSLYLYMETGMQAPANAFKSWTAAPKAVALLDRRLAEDQAGLYQTAFRPRTAGAFELVAYLPNPKTVRCFDLAVAGEGPDLAETLRPPSLSWTRPETLVIAGEAVELRFRLERQGGGDAPGAHSEAEVLVMAPGQNWHWRGQARPLGDDSFRVSLTLPAPGNYQLLVRAPAEHLDFPDQQPFSLNAVAGR